MRVLILVFAGLRTPDWPGIEEVTVSVEE